MENKKLKNRLSALVLAASMTSTPAMANINTNDVDNTNTTNDTFTGDYSIQNYVMDQDNFYGIKVSNKEEDYDNKRNYLMNELLRAYSVEKESEIPFVTLQQYFDEMYGENAFVTLKEYEYRIKGLSVEEAYKERANKYLGLSYEVRQQGLFPNSDFKETRQNTIDRIELEIQALDNFIKNGSIDDYSMMYSLNEYVTACLGNASLNGKIEDFSNVWDYYKKHLLNTVIARLEMEGQTIEMDMIKLGSAYPNYQKIENNPITYNTTENANQYKLK